MPARVFLQQLYPEADASPSTAPNFDVVLVHGVNGDPVKTWESKNTATDQDRELGDTVLWPQHLLPTQFPGARVFSFGYNGDIYHNDSSAGIRDLAKTLLSSLSIQPQSSDPTRPIIFIAHCLGGLIVKQALHTAHYEKDYNIIASRTKGIFFFGTPHVASSKDQWDNTAKSYSSLDKRTPSSPTTWLKRSRLVRALQKDSVELVDMMDKFRHMMLLKDLDNPPTTATRTRWAIVNFYEMEKMPGAKSLIVSATAAQLDVPGEVQKGVHADHAGMVKFGRRDDLTFGEVCKEIRKVVIPEGERSVGGGALPVGNNGRVNVELSAVDEAGRVVRVNGTLTGASVGYGTVDGRVREAPGREGYASSGGTRQGYLLPASESRVPIDDLRRHLDKPRGSGARASQFETAGVKVPVRA
ncbi:hypothetical protein QBC41DRAFT_399327 [Cercophora samala]|uniref:DUF676 domain-containing protein n=1 Tax=Cercophora samala TaxID=330535 RepID=A0AA40DA53_9PEZI|nr:hypothetical protein QBC41DRAFT_399327 [Cercophora samala]